MLTTIFVRMPERTERIVLQNTGKLHSILKTDQIPVTIFFSNTNSGHVRHLVDKHGHCSLSVKRSWFIFRPVICLLLFFHQILLIIIVITYEWQQQQLVQHRLYCFHVKNSTKLKKQTNKKNAVGNFLWAKTSLSHICAIIKATHQQTFNWLGPRRH